MTDPFDEQAALDDLLAELFGEHVVVAVDDIDLVEVAERMGDDNGPDIVVL